MKPIAATLIRLWLAALLAGLSTTAFAGAYEDFFAAVRADNADQVAGLLQRGLDPNLLEDDRGETGLMIAVRENAVKVFEMLVKTRGVDLDVQARNGDTALMIAAFKGNAGMVETLLRNRAAVNKPGWTALHYGAASGNIKVVQLLLSLNAEVNARSPNNTTPMMMAARGGHIQTVKLLLDSGADPSLKNDVGMSALDFAEQGGFKDIVEGLTFQLKKAGKI